jgi:hypothetical protein
MLTSIPTIFNEVWQRVVQANLAELTLLWDDPFGEEWLNEISGGTVNANGLKMSVYKRFDELTPETQYAFACWVKEQKNKPNEEA